MWMHCSECGKYKLVKETLCKNCYWKKWERQVKDDEVEADLTSQYDNCYGEW